MNAMLETFNNRLKSELNGHFSENRSTFMRRWLIERSHISGRSGRPRNDVGTNGCQSEKYKPDLPIDANFLLVLRLKTSA
jgi:hypothetical protein